MKRALVVYESMYGNTHSVAIHIADGMRPAFDVTIVPVGEATEQLLDDSNLVVVGGPTHAHSMSRAITRKAARDALKKDKELALDPDAEGPGLREWFDGMADGYATMPAVAFDTRIDASPIFTGRASRGIARRLHHRGFRLALEPESFLVDKHNHLLDGEVERAEAWGAAISAAINAGVTPRVG